MYFNESIAEAVGAFRMHHQLIPMQLEFEYGFKASIINGMAKMGHKIVIIPPDDLIGSVTAIGRDGNQLKPVFDPRRGGSTEII